MSPMLAKPLRLTESRSVGHNAVGVVPISECSPKGERGIDATKKLLGEGFKRPWPPRGAEALGERRPTLIRMAEAVKGKIADRFGH